MFFVYKNRYGFEKVRGSYWCNLDQNPPPSTIEEYRLQAAEKKRLARFKSAKLQRSIFDEIESNPDGIDRSLLEQSFKAQAVERTLERCLLDPPLVVITDDKIFPISMN